ncbi:rhodanese-like domain-containing protein [Spiractinospora alimapuensis]|uniref:rhodanese-like domain-containing protein n=1 Tax=Spiractinospora alimapuensis TaxID=2820884 RepID=UPI001F18B4F9|nr:rhodanese-like domain-containing protein [Spiractinospora alimapuensis]QVQ50448.1 rhodanese-like domain-containing protein [Spiractinospora alimapuensis]
MHQTPEIDAASVPEDGFLLDVREDVEWNAGHAPHAVHVPLGQLAARVSDVPQDRDVYVVCRSGGRSAQATDALNDAGWRATNVAGGMKAWEMSGRAMTSENGNDPQVA